MHNFWFNNFIERYDEGNADYYIFFGLYPIYHQKKNIKSKSAFWKSVILCFSEKEIINLLKKIKTRREKKTDKFFGFGFETGSKIYGTRGFEKSIDLSKFLLENKLAELKQKLK